MPAIDRDEPCGDEPAGHQTQIPSDDTNCHDARAETLRDKFNRQRKIDRKEAAQPEACEEPQDCQMRQVGRQKAAQGEDAEGVRFDLKRPKIRVQESEGLVHAWCLRQSEVVAERVGRWLREVTQEGAGSTK